MTKQLLLMLLLSLFLSIHCSGGDQGETGPTGPKGSIGPTGSGEAGPTGETGSTGVGETGQNAECYNSNPPVISKVICNGVEGCNNMFVMDHPYSIRIEASEAGGGGGTGAFSYEIVGVGGNFYQDPGNGSIFQFVPVMVGGPFTFTAIVSDSCQVAMKDFTIESVDIEGWSYLGDKPIGHDNVNRVSMFVHNGTPFIAQISDDLLQVLSFEAGAWNYVGNQGPFSITDGHEDYRPISIAVSPSGVTYVAFYDPSNPPGQRGKVMRLNGSNSWEYVGTPGLPISPSSLTYINCDPAGFPYVAFLDSTDGSKGKVVKLNGSNGWEYVGNAPAIPTSQPYFSFALNPAGVPYVAFYSTDSDKLKVVKLNGSNGWEYAGSSLSPSPPTVYQLISLAFNSAGTPYVSYVTNDSGEKLKVVKLNEANSWEEVGITNFIIISQYYNQIAVSQGGIPYVAFRCPGVTFPSVCAKKFSGGQWHNLGWTGLSSGNLGSGIDQYSFFVYKTIPYIAFLENIAGATSPVVMKYVEESP